MSDDIMTALKIADRSVGGGGGGAAKAPRRGVGSGLVEGFGVLTPLKP